MKIYLIYARERHGNWGTLEKYTDRETAINTAHNLSEKKYDRFMVKETDTDTHTDNFIDGGTLSEIAQLKGKVSKDQEGRW